MSKPIIHSIEAPKPLPDPYHRSSPHVHDRRVFLTSILAATAPAILRPSPANASPLTPYQRGFNLEYGLLPDERIRACDAGANPNCVSTSSLTNLYSPPWIPQPANPAAAMEEFDAALRGLSPESELLETQKTSRGGLYRRYKLSNPVFQYDILEVLINPQLPPYESESIVTFRSQAGTIKYVWPITQPVSDLDAQKKRIAGLRRRLDWKILGGDCSVIECFQE